MKSILFPSFLALLLLNGCAGTVSVGHRPTADGRGPHEARKISKLHIPPGHLPPPGTCRIWIPGLPPGKQSPPGDCGSLASAVPPGAWLLGRPKEEPGVVEVSVYDSKRRGVVIEVEWYVAATGELVRHGAAR